jgi:oligopeptidase B
METEAGKTAKYYWQEVIPNRKDVLLETVTVFKDFLVLGERKDGIRQIRVIGLTDRSDHYLEFDEEAYVAYPSDNHPFDTNVLRYNYTSMTTPVSTFDYDMSAKEKTLLKVEEVGGKFDRNDYRSERLWATVRDSTVVPISLVYRQGLIRDGQSPLFLYGYGSYGNSMDPYFRSERLSLLDRGFVFAMAHIRGGAEMGRYWYEDGKLLKKKNTFNDFIDCAEFLVAQKYTKPEKLFAMGGSAGGLLMGAVVNMRPDLFRGIIAAVPWVDVVTTMLDDSIPLTTVEFDEWGNPKDSSYYEYMLSYSPYDNVIAQDYPAMFVTTGLHDSQVQYFEPAKWVAKLRDLKTDDNLIVMDVDMESGHGGASGRFKRHERTAMEYAFMLNLLGIMQ